MGEEETTRISHIRLFSLQGLLGTGSEKPFNSHNLNSSDTCNLSEKGYVFYMGGHNATGKETDRYVLHVITLLSEPLVFSLFILINLVKLSCLIVFILCSGMELLFVKWGISLLMVLQSLVLVMP
jgi:hypothetical protein